MNPPNDKKSEEFKDRIKDLFDWYFWSFDIALVVIVFYSLGHKLKHILINKWKYDYHLLFIAGFIHFSLFIFCGEINIYRAKYGNSFLLFFLNGISACIFYIQLFKCLPTLKFLSFLGRNTFQILAMHIKTLLVIKLFILLFNLVDSIHKRNIRV